MMWFVLGLLLVLGGVGGIEHSQTTVPLLQAVTVAMVGLVIMWLGTLELNEK